MIFAARRESASTEERFLMRRVRMNAECRCTTAGIDSRAIKGEVGRGERTMGKGRRVVDGAPMVSSSNILQPFVNRLAIHIVKYTYLRHDISYAPELAIFLSL